MPSEIIVKLLSDSPMSCRNIGLQDTFCVSAYRYLNRAMDHTRPFIYAEHRNTHARTPCRYLCHLIHQSLQACRATLLAFQLYNHTQMLGYPAEILHVLSNKLRSSVMVIENGKDAIKNHMIGLPYPYVDGE